ncbi:hypothetical protein [Rhodobacter calidifons]|uniref:DUF4347 domain-containing protein n=1 Tax=Rhodobacter calidifons TaxID=2715277 RepID=A0ABX0G581_9RHOB|nr:hypothetical protein [Rhodobacter calidifons]NHB76004.1 hypothetical protein [Rhodobacter calidifons]
MVKTDTPHGTQAVILMNDAALSLAPELVAPGATVQVIVAGPSMLRLALAEAALPEARVICADFGQSASLAALEEKVRGMGRLHRLVLAADGADAAEIFSVMRTIVVFLPALRRGEGSVLLTVRPGAALAALRLFLRRVQPTLDGHGVPVTLVEKPAVTT